MLNSRYHAQYAEECAIDYKRKLYNQSTDQCIDDYSLADDVSTEGQIITKKNNEELLEAMEFLNQRSEMQKKRIKKDLNKKNKKKKKFRIFKISSAVVAAPLPNTSRIIKMHTASVTIII